MEYIYRLNWINDFQFFLLFLFFIGDLLFYRRDQDLYSAVMLAYS